MMTTGAMILGIIGGVVGLIVGILSLTFGALVAAVSELPGGEELGIVAIGAFAVFGFAIVGLVGGAMAKAKPVVAGILMLVGGGGGFLAGWFWLFAGILLIIGGILAIAGRKEAAKGTVSV